MIEPTFPPPPTDESRVSVPVPRAGPAFPGSEPAPPRLHGSGPPGSEPASAPRAAGRRRDMGMLLTASFLSAALAAGATVAFGPRSAAPAAPAAMASATGATSAAVAGITTAATTTSSVAAIAAAASPAVVTIQTTVTSQGFGRSAAGAATGIGSGFIYAADGFILTAAHVVEGASRVSVTLADGRTFTGTIAASDLSLDVAVVKIAASGLPTIALGSSSGLRIGQTLIAIGDPLGEYPGSVTLGIVSGLDRSVTVADDVTREERDLSGLVQTDAAINQGNSGGPLLDASGTVIGIISAGSSSAEGIGFAVPIDAAAAVLEAARGA